MANGWRNYGSIRAEAETWLGRVEIPAELLQWRQSPGDVNSRGGTQSRALNARRGGFGGGSGCFGG